MEYLKDIDINKPVLTYMEFKEKYGDKNYLHYKRSYNWNVEANKELKDKYSI